MESPQNGGFPFLPGTPTSTRSLRLSPHRREPPPVFEIGSSLREARTKRGFTTEDVHKAIHVRTRYLTALEEERWELLPGEAYTKGFLRTYAEFLDLNSDLYVDEFDERIAVHDEQPFVPDSLAPSGRRRLLFRSIAGSLGVVALVGVAAWQLGGP